MTLQPPSAFHGRRPERPPTSPPTKNGRDAGEALIHRLNGWLITGAVAAAGLVSLVAANSFHGRASGPTVRASNSAAVAPRSASTTRNGLQPPAQSPVPAPATSPAVVSGGS